MHGQLGRMTIFIRCQVRKNESMCLQELGLSREDMEGIYSRWAPNCNWSVKLGLDNRVGAFIMLGGEWIVSRGGKKAPLFGLA